MGFLDKFQKFGNGLRGPGDDIDDEYIDDEDGAYDPDEGYDDETAPVKKETPRVERMNTEASRPITRSMSRGSNLPGLNIAIRRPTEFAAVGDIAADVLEGQTVAINLEYTTKATAIRIFDFLSGVAYSVEAKIEPVADNTYIIVPHEANITKQELADEAKASEEATADAE